LNEKELSCQIKRPLGTLKELFHQDVVIGNERIRGRIAQESILPQATLIHSSDGVLILSQQ